MHHAEIGFSSEKKKKEDSCLFLLSWDDGACALIILTLGLFWHLLSLKIAHEAYGLLVQYRKNLSKLYKHTDIRYT
jgi:hypothetical protein